MFGIFQKKQATEVDLSLLQVDFHSHLIPGVDDGSQSLEETIELLQSFVTMGYSRIYTSPHIMGERYTNTKSDLLQRCADLKAKPEIAALNLQIDVIAEYLLDEKFEQLLKINDFLTIKDKYILIETSMNYEFPFVRDYIYELIRLGYQPILAHPERYRYIHNEKNALDIYESMLDWGLEFQLNLFSLIGSYGELAQRTAELLIDRNLYSYACSDIHRVSQIKYFEEIKKSLFLGRLLKSSQLKNHLFL